MISMVISVLAETSEYWICCKLDSYQVIWVILISFRPASWSNLPKQGKKKEQLLPFFFFLDETIVTFLMNNNLLMKKKSSHTRKVYKRSSHPNGVENLKLTRSTRDKEKKFGTKDIAQSKKELKEENFNCSALDLQS